MPEDERTPVLELFQEYFGGWLGDIEETEQPAPDYILITMKNGTRYQFGYTEDGPSDVYLKTLNRS